MRPKIKKYISQVSICDYFRLLCKLNSFYSLLLPSTPFPTFPQGGRSVISPLPCSAEAATRRRRGKPKGGNKFFKLFFLGPHPCLLRDYLLYSSKKSFPLSSVMIKAAIFSTLIFRTASIPRSSKSTISTDLIFSAASIAAGPPIDPR